MSVLIWVLVGLGAGWLAGAASNESEQGVVGDVALGIFGALVGGLLSAVFLGTQPGGLSPLSIVCAAAGAGIVLVIVRRFLEGGPTDGTDA